MKKSFIIPVFLLLFCCFHRAQAVGEQSGDIFTINLHFSPATYLLTVLKSKQSHGAAIGTCGTMLADLIINATINRIQKEELKESEKKSYLPNISKLSFLIASIYGLFLSGDENRDIENLAKHVAVVSLVLAAVYTVARLGKEVITFNEDKRYGLIKNIAGGIKQAVLNAGACSSSYFVTQRLKELNY